MWYIVNIVQFRILNLTYYNITNLEVIGYVIIIIATLLGTLISVAYYTLFERKVLAAMQRRRGPNIVGFFGILQPLADGLKLMSKEGIVPILSVYTVYLIAPILSIIISFMGWTVLPIFYENSNYVNSDFDILIFFCLTALGSYGVVLAGWGSFSRYAVMGALRAIAQLISYEIIFLITMLPGILFVGSFNFMDYTHVQANAVWLIFPTLPSSIIFYILMLAETNRTPFDLPEAEAELVSGFNVEYSSILFAMFSLSEYNSMLLMSTLYVVIFLGAWAEGVILFVIKVIFIAFSIIKMRAALPRYRYDQLMFLCWYIFLPLSLSLLIFTYGIVQYFNINVYNPAELLFEISIKYKDDLYNL